VIFMLAIRVSLDYLFFLAISQLPSLTFDSSTFLAKVDSSLLAFPFQYCSFFEMTYQGL